MGSSVISVVELHSEAVEIDFYLKVNILKEYLDWEPSKKISTFLLNKSCLKTNKVDNVIIKS